MIALGVSPGIKSLAYCALEWDDSARIAIVLHQDVMSPRQILRAGSDGRPPTIAALAKRFLCHQLILTTVWQRHEPSVLSIGPAAVAEPPANVELARQLVAELGRMAGVEVVESTPQTLETAFRTTSRRTLKGALKGRVSTIPRDRRGVLAAAAAFYGLAHKNPALLLPP